MASNDSQSTHLLNTQASIVADLIYNHSLMYFFLYGPSTSMLPVTVTGGTSFGVHACICLDDVVFVVSCEFRFA
jgi:hypothetical protein